MMWTHALVGRLDVVEFDAEVGAVFAEGIDLLVGDLVDDVEAVFNTAGGDVVVDCCDGAVGAAELAGRSCGGRSKPAAGDLVNEVAGRC